MKMYFSLYILIVGIITLSYGRPRIESGRNKQSQLRLEDGRLESGHSQGSQLSLEDVFISVKTSQKFHGDRVQLILDTWYPRAAPSTWLFSDRQDSQLVRSMENAAAKYGANIDTIRTRLVNTNCGSGHNRRDLSCKMEAELTEFLTDQNRHYNWFCHVDDDNYLNVERLLELLDRFERPRAVDWYVGKASIPSPLQIPDKHLFRHKKPSMNEIRSSNDGESELIDFWFATGGAGFCLSRHLADRMRNHVVAGAFQSLADAIRLPDDVTLGYLVEVGLGVNLTQVVDRFHSHLEPLHMVTDPAQAVTLSYSGGGNNAQSVSTDLNVIDFDDINVKLDNPESSQKDDWTKLRSLHCSLYPKECS